MSNHPEAKKAREAPTPRVVSTRRLNGLEKVEGHAGGMLSGKTVGAVTNAISILRYLNEAQRPLGLSQVAKGLQLHSSTCFNILRTLAREELVYFDPESKLYSAGLGLIELARGAALQVGDVYSVRPHMSRLAREEAVTVTLWRRVSQTRMMLVVGALSASNVRIQINVGHTLPFAAGSVGRVMSAYSGFSTAAIRDIFQSVRWDNPPSFTDFHSQLEDVRRTGYSVDEGQFINGMCSVAVPVEVPDRPMTLACSALMFAGQNNPEKVAVVVERLREISRILARISAEE